MGTLEALREFQLSPCMKTYNVFKEHLLNLRHDGLFTKEELNKARWECLRLIRKKRSPRSV